MSIFQWVKGSEYSNKMSSLKYITKYVTKDNALKIFLYSLLFIFLFCLRALNYFLGRVKFSCFVLFCYVMASNFLVSCLERSSWLKKIFFWIFKVLFFTFKPLLLNFNVRNAVIHRTIILIPTSCFLQRFAMPLWYSYMFGFTSWLSILLAPGFKPV